MSGESDQLGLHLTPSTERAEPSPDGLIDSIVAATAAAARIDREKPPANRQPKSDRLDRFLQQPCWAKALCQWFGWTDKRPPRDKRRVARALERHIAELDALLTDQVNAILHHDTFQRLEASWLGLRYLVGQTDDENVKIRVLSVTWKELARDAERAIEFDQSQLFRKVYSDEFGTPGGEPFGVLLGDYEIHPKPSAEHPLDDLAVLEAISHVAAAAFAPFVTGVHPSMFGLDDFTQLEQPLNLPRWFDQQDFLKWRSFRQQEDSRFVGLTLPRVLMRIPYEDDDTRTDGFRFQEDVQGPDRGRYLWGNAVYGYGAMLGRCFAQSAWLADVRGVRRDVEGGGMVTGLPLHSFSTDAQGVAAKCSTDVIITDQREPELSDLGFLPLCHCKHTEFAAFYSSRSPQKPKVYDDPQATANARISSMLQYTLCVSRFAHYLKVAARDKLGAFSEPGEIEDYLYRWLQQYVTADDDAGDDVKARYPLREAKVSVREHPEKPGGYICVAHLRPHFELDDLTASLKVTTELAPGRAT